MWRRAVRRLWLVGVPLACGLALSACDAPPELQPDQLLRDSLGLTSRDRVHTVLLMLDEGRETARPGTLHIRPGDWVEFRSGDGFVRLIRFVPDSVSVSVHDWLSVHAAGGSPPLVSAGARWMVHFLDAPPGRYPFLLEGNRRDGSGVVIVDAGRRFPFYNR